LTWAHDSGDGGELAAAAYTLGIPHPPGYPTYTLIAHLFTRLPLGEVAVRTNLFSALCAAGASALLTWTLARSQGRWAPAVGAGLALAFSPLLWSQATVTEVYALNGLFAALLLALLACTRRDNPRGPRAAMLLALAIGSSWGLSLGNHPTALFCAPIVFLALWRLGRPGMLGGLGIAFGLAVYLYLPLRAVADPPVNWGDPQTWDRFWWMVSGAPYRPFVFSLPSEHLVARLLAWSGLLARQFGRIGLVAAALGALALWRTDRSLLYATGTTIALCSILAIGYNTTDSYLYLVPALVCLALWLGRALNWLLSLQAPQQKWVPRAKLAAAALFILAPLAAGAYRFPAMDLSQDRTVREFRDVVLSQAPPHALIQSQQDKHTFALWYLQHALGWRPDVDTVDLDLLGDDWYAEGVSRQLGVALPGSLTVGAGRHPDRWSVALGRPVCRIDNQGTIMACTVPESD
jgi:hypothetical protein